MLILFLECKTLDNWENPIGTASLELGMVGFASDGIIGNNFKTIGTPLLTSKIRLKPEIRYINKKEFFRYQRFANQRDLTYKLRYIDSISEKPEYVHLAISDRVGIIKSLNKAINVDIYQSIRTDDNLKIITTIDCVFSADYINLIRGAEAVYLYKDPNNIPIIQIAKEGKELNIPFKECVVLSYQTSSFCWGKDKRREIKLMGLRKNKGPCAGHLERTADKLIRDLNYFKL
tara:strand:+ start:689 stop:1384 length:696 start_codon:yes stop_codon:yes gene_type:complete